MRTACTSRPRPADCAWVLALVLALAAGCASQPDRALPRLAAAGDFGHLRDRVERSLPPKPSDRNYMLARLRLLLAALADGYPRDASVAVSDLYAVLRTQGVNDDKTVAAAVLGDGGVLYWKGEPFEQALAYTNIAIQQALLGQWDNARAAASSSLFLLKDFGDNERGQRKSTQEIAETGLRRESAGNGTFETYLDKGYTPIKTDFALGYLMNGAANWVLAAGDPARRDEALDNFHEAARINSSLAPLVELFESGYANTVLIVDYGVGPEKIQTGPDGSLARFSPRAPSDSRPLEVKVNGTAAGSFAAACDVNRMAADHAWNNLEDIRRAKSAIGSAMMIGGAVVAGSSNDQQTQLIGLGILLGGLLVKATSAADVRHCEVLPQRTYFVPIRIDSPGSTVSVSVAQGGSIMTLPCLDPPSNAEVMKLIYVRLPSPTEAGYWAGAEAPLYAADSCDARVAGDELPYILGGRCVRSPGPVALAHYQAAGWLTDLTAAQLADLYRAEGISVSQDPRDGLAGLHVLEGGHSLRAPIAGSAGFVRLLCREHPRYVPHSREVMELAERIRAEQAHRAAAAGTAPQTPH